MKKVEKEKYRKRKADNGKGMQQKGVSKVWSQHVSHVACVYNAHLLVSKSGDREKGRHAAERVPKVWSQHVSRHSRVTCV